MCGMMFGCVREWKEPLSSLDIRFSNYADALRRRNELHGKDVDLRSSFTGKLYICS